MTRIDCNPESFQKWTALHDLMMAAFLPEVGRVDPAPSMMDLSVEDLSRKALHEDFFVTQGPLTGCVFGRPEGAAYYIGKLAVAPTAQGHGIGRALLAATGQRGRELGMAKLQLGTRIELLENHRVFRALGFHLVTADRHQGYSRPTAFVFEKKL